ncbi:hypothetical protein Tco_1101419 [Tanacetum coccineum]
MTFGANTRALRSFGEEMDKTTTLNNNEIDFRISFDESDDEDYTDQQNILYFNDLFPFNIVYSNDQKSDKGNDDNEIDMIESSRDMAPLPLREQRHTFLGYQDLEYSDQDIADFEERLEWIHDRGTHRVQVLDFEGGAKRHLSWREFILTLGLHTREEMESLSFARRFAVRRKSEALISGGQFEGDAGGVAEETLVVPRGGDEDEEMPQAVPPLPRTQGERIA